MALLRRSTISHFKRKQIITGVFLALIITLSMQVSSARAGAESTTCIGNGGSWSGDIPSDVGTCSYPAGSLISLTNCSSEPEYSWVKTFYLGGTTSSYCIIPAGNTNPSDSHRPGPAALGKCKLLSVNTPIGLGSLFEASWIGKLDSIRFRQSGGTISFVSAIPGTIHFEDGHRAGTFHALGLNRGRWEATCWGPEGTFGTAKIVFIN